MRKAAVPLISSSRTDPGQPLWGAHRPCTTEEDTPRGQFLGLHLPGSQPPGTGARLQRPPAAGGGQGPHARLSKKGQGEPRWRQGLGVDSPLRPAGQPRLRASTWALQCFFSDPPRPHAHFSRLWVATGSGPGPGLGHPESQAQEQT